MPKPKSLPRQELPAAELWFIRLCFIVAFGISAFLAWNSFKGGGIPGCGPESGCDKVLSSRWAYAVGLPISVFALPVYLGILFLLRPSKLQWALLSPLALLVLLSALWFVGVQTFALRAFCKFCMAAHTAGVLGALMLLRRTSLPLPRLATSFGLALAAVTVLAGAQFASPERGPKQIVNAPSPIVVPPQPVSATSNVQPTPAVETPKFTIVDGQFTLDLGKVPVTGPLNAPKKFAKLFDYTCHHCRDLHRLLHDFRAKHKDELAIISLPLPLDSKCNPMIRSTPPAHANSCEYAKLGLAIFHANPAKFEEYSDWIYSTEHPPELALARQYAEKLVGAANLEQALQNPAIGEQIRLDINIYTAASRIARSGQLPQLYFAQGASIGAISSKEQLEGVMAVNLGLK